MNYQHSLAFQTVLQQALRVRRRLGRPDQPGRQLTWEDIARQFGMSKQAKTLARFNATDLAAHLERKGWMCLDYGLAARLWDALADQVHEVLGNIEKNGPPLIDERTIANSVAWQYRTHQKQIARWKADGLADQYFCYKPSFRLAGHIVKSEFNLRAVGDEYFAVTDRQKADLTSIVRIEESTGFAFTKSDRLWAFLKETDREQPRVFLFHRMQIAQHPSNGGGEVRSIARLFGRVLESDRKFRDGAFGYKVALVSLDAERRTLAPKRRRAADYNPADQANIVPYTPEAQDFAMKGLDTDEIADRKARIDKVRLDQEAVKWIQRDVEAPPDPLDDFQY